MARSASLWPTLVDFTPLSRRLTPTQLVAVLNRLFSCFDDEAERYGIEKIKTIGDAYLAVGGMSGSAQDHAERAALFALAIQHGVERLSRELDLPISIRVGLHIGPVVAGVIGTKRPAFDCWGDTVNVATRLETAARPSGVLISESAYWRLRDRFSLSPLDEVVLKGIGPATVFLLQGRRGQSGPAHGFDPGALDTAVSADGNMLRHS
jgi:adenylate cyclase